ncbi:MAG: hypothetical protein AAGA30_09820 [Planctomycetota bacterium]
MRLNLLGNVSFYLIFLGCLNLGAQNQSEEFIESYSPTSDGGQVVSRASASLGIQTITTSGDRRLNTDSTRSVLDSRSKPRETGARESVFRQSVSAPQTGQEVKTGGRYPYPAATVSGNRVASTSGLLLPPLRAKKTCENCQVPYQISTLGLNNSQLNQVGRQNYGGNCCAPPPAYSPLQVQAFQAPALQFQQPAVANQVPALGVPTNNAPFTTGVGTNPVYNPQQSSFLTPFVTGSGVYQPIIRLANVRPGTYLGQGIIGQPTAYVDGQPIRNLLRYISP